MITLVISYRIKLFYITASIRCNFKGIRYYYDEKLGARSWEGLEVSWEGLGASWGDGGKKEKMIEIRVRDRMGWFTRWGLSVSNEIDDDNFCYWSVLVGLVGQNHSTKSCLPYRFGRRFPLPVNHPNCKKV